MEELVIVKKPAEQILKFINKRLQDTNSAAFVDIIEAFAIYNGRERLIGISARTSKSNKVAVVLFGKNKNSDNIVIYSAIIERFGLNPPIWDHIPKEAWKSRKMFNHDEIEEAAKTAISELINLSNLNDKLTPIEYVKLTA